MGHASRNMQREVALGSQHMSAAFPSAACHGEVFQHGAENEGRGEGEMLSLLAAVAKRELVEQRFLWKAVKVCGKFRFCMDLTQPINHLLQWKEAKFCASINCCPNGGLAMNAWLTVGFFTPRVASTQHHTGTAGQPSRSAGAQSSQHWLCFMI